MVTWNRSYWHHWSPITIIWYYGTWNIIDIIGPPWQIHMIAQDRLTSSVLHCNYMAPKDIDILDPSLQPVFKLNQISCQSCCLESQIINIKLNKSFKKVPGPPPKLSASGWRTGSNLEHCYNYMIPHDIDTLGPSLQLNGITGHIEILGPLTLYVLNF